MIGLKSRASFSTNRRQNENQLRYFSRIVNKLQVIARNFDWFIALFALVVIGRRIKFGIGFSTVILKLRY